MTRLDIDPRINFKKLTSKQKQAVVVIMSNKVLNTNDKIKGLNILNVFKLKTYHIIIFIFRPGQGTISTVFQSRFKRIHIHILHDFVRATIMKNLSNSIKLNF